MRQLAIAAACAITTALVFMSTHHPPMAAWTSRTWRKAVYKSTYQAWMHCNAPDEDIIPNSYFVFLHWGYPLDEHKQAMKPKVSLDGHIERVFEQTHSYGTYYAAKLDNASLEAVRADVGVDFVECNRRIYPMETVDPFETIYKAPLGPDCARPKDELIPDAYVVMLHRGYSLEDHRKAISDRVNLQYVIRHLLSDSVEHGLSYAANMDRDSLSAIREDVGVNLVKCQIR